MINRKKRWSLVSPCTFHKLSYRTPSAFTRLVHMRCWISGCWMSEWVKKSSCSCVITQALALSGATLTSACEPRVVSVSPPWWLTRGLTCCDLQALNSYTLGSAPLNQAWLSCALFLVFSPLSNQPPNCTDFTSSMALQTSCSLSVKQGP